ncbi:MAG TPA: hypothetical protein VLK84_13865 [Longimicrobium sp.]|nr:hypothetical protein [Longimicrobium sp.]
MDTASDLKAFMVRQIEELQLAYAIGGSMAAMAYSVPRFTRDVDIVVDLPLDRVPEFVARFPRPDFYIDEATVRQAVRDRSQFNIIHNESGVKVDIYIPADPLQKNQIKRARRLISESGEANYSPPEELIIMKMTYYQYGQTDRRARTVRRTDGTARGDAGGGFG